MSYGNAPDPYGAPQQPGYPQQSGGFPGQPSGFPDQPGGYPGQPGGMPGGYPGQPGGYAAGGYQFGTPALSPEVAPLPGANPAEAVKRFFQRYAQFRGYASRSEFWWIQLFLVIFEVIAYIVIFAPLLASVAASSGDPAAAESAAAAGGAGTVILALVFLVIFLALVVPYLALCVRRLHDAGQSGWLVLVNFVPYVGTIAPFVIGLLPSRPDLYRPEWS